MSWLSGDSSHGPAFSGVNTISNAKQVDNYNDYAYGVDGIVDNDLTDNGSIQSSYDLANSAAARFYEQQIENEAVNRSWTSRENEINREFQQYNSDTAHQREVQDLIAAGLNPVLSTKYGGASTPSGSSQGVPSSSAASVGGTVFSSLFSSATGLLRTILQNEQSERNSQRQSDTNITTTGMRNDNNVLVTELKNANNITVQEIRNKNNLAVKQLDIDADLLQTHIKNINSRELEKLKGKIKDEYATKHASNAWEAIWPEVSTYIDKVFNSGSEEPLSQGINNVLNFMDYTALGYNNNVLPTTIIRISEMYPDVPIQDAIDTWKIAQDKYKNGDQVENYFERLMMDKGYPKQNAG